MAQTVQQCGCCGEVGHNVTTCPLRQPSSSGVQSAMVWFEVNLENCSLSLTMGLGYKSCRECKRALCPVAHVQVQALSSQKEAAGLQDNL